MNMYNRFDFFVKIAKEGKALKKSPRQVYESSKYDGLRRFLPKDRKLRKKGHVLGIVNDLLEAINTVYGIKPFIDFNTELAKLYGMFLPSHIVNGTGHSSTTPEGTEEPMAPSVPFTEKQKENVLDRPSAVNAGDIDHASQTNQTIVVDTVNREITKTSKRNEVFTPAKIDPNRLERIKSAVKEYVESNEIPIDDAVMQYQTIKVDESKYTEKVDPEIAKLLGLNEDGELV